MKPHLDYDDINYDQPYNESMCQTVESIQYKAASAITGPIKGTSHAKLHK